MFKRKKRVCAHQNRNVALSPATPADPRVPDAFIIVCAECGERVWHATKDVPPTGPVETRGGAA